MLDLKCFASCIVSQTNASQRADSAGVNPMITAESIAWMVADGVAARFKHC